MKNIKPNIDDDLIETALKLSNTSLHPDKQAALLIAQTLREVTAPITDSFMVIVDKLDEIASLLEQIELPAGKR